MDLHTLAQVAGPRHDPNRVHVSRGREIAFAGAG